MIHYWIFVFSELDFLNELIKVWVWDLLDVDVSAEYDSTVDNREEGGITDIECDEIFTINFNSISGHDMEDVTIANIVEILYKQCSKGYLETVGPNEHHIDRTDDSPPY